MAEPSLDKLLRLASTSQLEPAALGTVDKGDDEAHSHLMRECPWYKAVCDGEAAAKPEDHCKGGGALVKLTPRTPEASTKVQPTVPPGGPGLFHVKGLHLPPYVEHLYPHLVARYGKKEAYRVAVGVVKKWAVGVNPGGWKTKSGKGKRTHPDVKAAAGKNVAEWEKDKAEGRAHVRASVPADSLVGVVHAGKLIPTPPPPKKTAPMMTAHRVADMCSQLAHGIERMDAARKTKDPALKKYEMIHVRNHLSTTLNNGHLLADNLRSHYPAEGRELDAVMKTLGLTPPALTSALKTATTAHLLQSTLNECTHSIRHADLMFKTAPGEWAFNADHCEKHLRGAMEHASKLREHILNNYPAEAKLLNELTDLFNGEEVKAAAPAAWPSGKPYAKSFLSPQRGTISAPGAGQFDYGQLQQEPSQTVSPSPPLPPAVDLPSPKEMRAFAAEVKKMADDADHHLAAAQMHLESAAEKMVTNPISALASLRSCQTAIQQAWRWRVQHAMPRIAYVFSANTPPAEQSSQQQIWAKEQDRIGEMQGAASKIAVFIDRVRRGYFGRMGMVSDSTAGGGLAGQPNARL